VGTVTFCLVSSFSSCWSNPDASVVFRSWGIRCCDTSTVVLVDCFRIKKMLRFSGILGVGAQMKLAY
jgi:hypothetical protein